MLTGRSTMSSHKMSENLLQPVGIVKRVCVLSLQISLVLTVFLQIDSVLQNSLVMSPMPFFATYSM